MMSLFAKIFHGTKKLHKETESKPFLSRYKTQDITLADHYYHLIQLLPIYKTIEDKLKEQNFHYNFPEDLQNILLNRSQEIQKDIEHLSLYVNHYKMNHVCKGTMNYVSKLQKIEEPEEVLSHFLVRIFGDLFGGQKIKSYVKSIYLRDKIKNCEQALNFYHFQEDSKVLPKLMNWLGQQTFSQETKMVEWANDSFRQHMEIFDELESKRSQYNKKPSCYGFFSLRSAALLSALSVTGLIVTLGY